MSKSSMTNIPAMAVGKMVDKLSQSYCTIIQKGLPVKTMPSVMLWGPPGVGKSQAVRQIAKIIERNTEKEVHVTDVRLLLFNPIKAAEKFAADNSIPFIPKETADLSDGSLR